MWRGQILEQKCRTNLEVTGCGEVYIDALMEAIGQFTLYNADNSFKAFSMFTPNVPYPSSSMSSMQMNNCGRGPWAEINSKCSQHQNH